MKPNIKTLNRGEFDWSDGKRGESLRTLYKEILAKFDDSMEWYQTRRVWKRRGAWILRVSAVVVGAFATALPTICETFGATTRWFLHPGYATILGVLVFTLVILDKLIGCSSAWIRYTMAETALKELRDELTVTFTYETGLWTAPGNPSVDQTRHTLAMCQGFLTRANQIVRDETNQWKAEFQSALQQTEDLSKVQPRKVEEAVGTVKITNPDRLAGPWWLSINGGAEEEGASDSKSFRLPPGPITIRIRTEIKTGPDGTKTRQYTTEASDTLAAGAPKEIHIPLPPN